MEHDIDSSSEAWLTALLNCLIPGDADNWPAAGNHGIAPQVLAFLQQQTNGLKSMETVFEECGADFCEVNQPVQVERLSNVETLHSEAFETILTATYNMYYSDPDIRQIIERLTGYEARPPQPMGYEMESFDERLLDTVRKREPFWRKETDISSTTES